MVRVRTGTIQLGRLLDEVGQPLYVLDAEATIVFANRACLDWVGQKAEDLQGQRCAYHSSPQASGPAAVAARLCPPPEALSGQEMTGIVACTVGEGRLSRRRARFVPLARGEDFAGLVVLVDPGELPEEEALAAAQADNLPATVGQVSNLPHETSEAARLHEQLRSFRQQAAARYRVDCLAGQSNAMRRARTQIELAAKSRANVLVVGPPGSGRQHAARAIHYAGSQEPRGPLVPLACSVIEEDSIVSTVAAIASRKPPAETADRGTLLLSDADTLSPAVQVEMARLLGAKAFPLRVIATSQRPLVELARQGKYREDLAHLLATLVIELPPLCDRRGDLPLLLQLFLEEANARGEKQLSGFTPEALDCLAAYPWPGNVDELVRVVNQSHQRAAGPQIALGDLPEQIHLAASAAAHPRRIEETIVLDEFLTGVEKELLQRAMARAKGNKTKAAKLLGISRARLARRLGQLGLE
jgi:DNA-binding NtrC family response regulator